MYKHFYYKSLEISTDNLLIWITWNKLSFLVHLLRVCVSPPQVLLLICCGVLEVG